MGAATVDEIYEQVRELPVEQRLRLVERIVHDVSRQVNGEVPQKRRRWRDIRGSAAGLLNGEDAQQWISRSRREDDEKRRV